MRWLQKRREKDTPDGYMAVCTDDEADEPEPEPEPEARATPAQIAEAMRLDHSNAQRREAELRDLERRPAAATNAAAAAAKDATHVSRLMCYRPESGSWASKAQGWAALLLGSAAWSFSEPFAAAVSSAAVSVVLALAAICVLRWCGFAKRTRLVQFSRLPKPMDLAGVLLAFFGAAAALGSGRAGDARVAVMASVAVAGALLWQQEVTMASSRTVGFRSACWPLLLVTLSVGAVLATGTPEPSMNSDLTCKWVIACWVGWLLVTLSASRLPLLVVATGLSTWPVSLAVVVKQLTAYSEDPSASLGSGDEETAVPEARSQLWVAVPLCAAGQFLVALDGSRSLSPAACLPKK